MGLEKNPRGEQGRGGGPAGKGRGVRMEPKKDVSGGSEGGGR